MAAAGGVRPVGLKALASLRMEKAYRDFGHDIDNTDCPLDVGLGFAIAWDTDFRGKEALLARKASFPSTQRLVQIRLNDPEPLLYHAEPVLRDGVVVGYVRAASYGWTLGGAVGLAFVGSDGPVTKDWLDGAGWEVDIAGDRYDATVSLRPMYDPTSRVASRERDHELATDPAGLEPAVGVRDALQRVGVGDVREHAGADLGGELVEPVAAGTDQDAVQVDVAVEGEVEVAAQVDDRRGVAPDRDVRQGRFDPTADQVDDRVHRVAQLADGRGRDVRLVPVDPDLDPVRLEPGAVGRPGGRRDAESAEHRHLHQQVTDASGRTMDQQPRAGVQRQPLQHLQRCAARERQRGSHDRVQLRRPRSDQLRGYGDHLGQGAPLPALDRQQGPHRLPGDDLAPRELVAHDVRRGEPRPGRIRAVARVDRVHPDRLDLDQHLARARSSAPGGRPGSAPRVLRAARRRRRASGYFGGIRMPPSTRTTAPFM